MSLIGRNIKYLRKSMRLTQAKFAEKIGIKRSLVGAYEEGRSDPRLTNLISMSRLFDVSVDALISQELTGLQLKEMKHLQVPKYDGRGSNVPDTKVLAITVDEHDNENIELVPTKASAGYANGYADPEYIRELPKFRLPMLPNYGTFRAFEISGDSMLPLESGTVLVGQYVESPLEIKNGKTYVLVTVSEGVVYKRVFNYIDENGKLFLVSDNKSYSPYEIEASDVMEVWEAKAFISVKFPDAQASVSEELPEKTMTMEQLTKIVLELKDEVVKLKEQ
ncbi:MAG: LexA family transcriptional regulator [Cytophagales bacterium]|nr:LexA family transcriptional regulator [Cytophagales bacterium]